MRFSNHELPRNTTCGLSFFFRKDFADMQLKASKKWIIPYVFLFSLSAMGAVSVPAAYAENEFAGKYRTYQAEVKAGKETFDKKEYQAAVEHYSRAIAMSPFEAMLYFNRGMAFYKSGKLKEAEEDFDNALTIDPRMLSSLSYRAGCREKLGKEEAALEDYTRALQQKPDDVIIHNNLAWLYSTEKVRDNLKALEHASRAAALSKEKNAGVLDTLARAYFINGKIKEAIEAEKKAIELEPGNREFNDNLARYETKAKI